MSVIDYEYVSSVDIEQNGSQPVWLEEADVRVSNLRLLVRVRDELVEG